MSRRLIIGCAIAMASSMCHAQATVPALAAYHSDKGALQANPDLEAIPNSILIKFKTATPKQNADAALAAASAARVRTYGLVPGLTHARTQLPVEQAIAVLAANPWVDYAEPDYVQRMLIKPNDPYFGYLWSLNNTGQSINGVAGVTDADIDMVEAWDITTGASGCAVAVIDSGTQWAHPDLDGNIWSNPGEVAGNGIDDDGNGFVDDVRGWDFFSDDNNPDDENGHGTHTAGTIAAEGNNGVGVAGVAWNCKIMPLRFLGADGSGSTADAIAALNYAVAKGIKVSNNSWGGGSYSASLYNAIANARGIGHVFVAAAGNSGVNTDSSPNYPSSYDLDNILSVAATDNRDQLAGFSNYGATSVDISAPGVDIASTYTGGGYVWSSGTSMAAPHAAGVAALLYARNPGHTHVQIIDRILSQARPVPALAGTTVTGGVLNAYASLAAVANIAPVAGISSPGEGTVFAPGTSITFSGSAADTEDGNLSALLNWSSNLDGAIGIGERVSTSVLREGSHIVTAAVTDSGGLKASKTVTVIIGSAPTAPDGVTATNNRNSTATIKWADKSSNEESFQIERQKKNPNGTWGSGTFFSIGAGVTSYLDKSGTGTFQYHVRARNKIGDSAWSTWVEVTVSRK